MKRKFKILKWGLGVFLSLIILLVSLFFWIRSLIPPRDANIVSSDAKNIAYITNDIPESRGKILAVVTSTDRMGTSDKSTGYELTELARAYYVFKANGFEVDIASPLGGKPPVVIDDEDMGKYDFAFLNDSIAQYKANHTQKVSEVIAEDYEAIYFVGGKGAMFDFPDNKAIQSLVRNYYQNDKVIGAVCHGPAALVNVTLDNGKSLLENKTVSSFTNEEELLLISDAKSIFPFLLQDKLVEEGARFNEGTMYLEKMSHDKNLITGQNPWSVWVLAETMVSELGYTPKYRPITDEEHAIHVLQVFENHGSEEARTFLNQLIRDEGQPVSRLLIAKHGILAAMKGRLGRFFSLLNLASYAKDLEEQE